jgi:hypothetical protein
LKSLPNDEGIFGLALGLPGALLGDVSIGFAVGLERGVKLVDFGMAAVLEGTASGATELDGAGTGAAELLGTTVRFCSVSRAALTSGLFSPLGSSRCASSSDFSQLLKSPSAQACKPV